MDHMNGDRPLSPSNNGVSDYDLQLPAWSLESLKAAAIQQRLQRPRSLAWAILLNALPPPNADITSSLKTHRNFYNDLKTKLSMDPRNVVGDDPLSQNDESAWNQHFCDNELKALILQDVVRTFPDELYFRDKDVQDMMVQVLFFWARSHAHVGYRQGMHEVLAPLLMELHKDRTHSPRDLSNTLRYILEEEYLEHDSYMLFSAIMKGLEKFYTTGDVVPSSSGRLPVSKVLHNPNEVVRYLDKVREECLKPLDSELAAQLVKCNISMELFGIRWLRLLFGREFPRAELPQLWGFLFADGPMLPNIHYVVVAILIAMKSTLMGGDSDAVLSALMRPPRLPAAHACALALHLRAPHTHPRPAAPPPQDDNTADEWALEQQGFLSPGSDSGSEGVAEGADVARALAALGLLRAQLPPAAAALARLLPDPPPGVAAPLQTILKTWRPANTPEVGTPRREASPKPGPSRARKCLVDSEIENFLNDSGSGSDIVSSDDEDEEPTDPGITMREAARRLREMVLQEEEGEHIMDVGDAGGDGDTDDVVAAENAGGARGDGGREDVVGAVNAGGARGDGGREDVVGAVNAGGARGDGVREDVVRAENAGGAGGDGGREDVVPGAGRPDLETFSWTANFNEFAGQEEVYTREPGPTMRSTDPLEIFYRIWDVTLLARIVEQTNLYAWQVISALSETDSITAYLDRWVDTTVNEVRRLFALMMLMSLDYRSRVADYWTTGILHMPAFRELMSRNRFQLLMRFLHFTNNYEMPPNLTSYEKKIYKVKEVFDYVMRKFSALYVPHRELALDETLLLWKGRLSWVQCIRSKATRFGIKSFELCESSTGYLLRSIIYAGKNSSFVEGAIHGFSNKTSKVVLELMDGFLDVGHLVVMDNWYNQMGLTRFLKYRMTDVLGTLNRNRLFVPNEIKNANQRQMARGQQVARHCGDIAVIAWKDVKLVTVLSTYHNDEQVLGRRGGQNVMKPVAVQTYNRTMGVSTLKT